MCPMVPTFTCGLLRSNFSLAMSSASSVSASSLSIRRRAAFASSRHLRASSQLARWPASRSASARAPTRAKAGADDQNRTGDLVLTKDALCQLSYIGLRARSVAARPTVGESAVMLAARRSSRNARGCQPKLARDRASEGWSGRRGSNPRPTAWKAVTLPLSYSRLRARSPLASALRARSRRLAFALDSAAASLSSPIRSARHRGSPAELATRAKVGGEGRTRTFEAARATDLQSAAFDRFATSPTVCCLESVAFRRLPAAGSQLVIGAGEGI